MTESPYPPNSPEVTQDYQPIPLAQTQDYLQGAEANRLARSLPAGTTLGTFSVIDKLGEGGMGTVYRAEQPSRQRQVALKVISPNVAQRPGFMQRFQREVRVMGKLEHPHIVRYLAAGEGPNGLIYLAMELVEGGSLGDWIRKLKTIPVDDVVVVGLATARALQHAHDQGLVHRDVKPDNILLTCDGSVKLADLGLAKATDDDTGLTQTGIGIGTPLYAAPEQTRNAKYADARSDLYALGGVLYHALTGKPPFPGQTLFEVIKAKESGTFPPPSQVRGKVPPALDRIILRLLAKLPEHRYPSCLELIEELSLLDPGRPTVSFVAS